MGDCWVFIRVLNFAVNVKLLCGRPYYIYKVQPQTSNVGGRMKWIGAAVFSCLLLSACAKDPYLKLSEDERRFIQAVDIYLEDEQVEAYLLAESEKKRSVVAEEWRISETYGFLPEAEKAAIDEGKVIEGMSKKGVIMSLGTPTRIRKQYETQIEAYVEIYQYRFERDKKGKVFLSPPNSRTAYKNEVFERHVEIVGGMVRAIKEVP